MASGRTWLLNAAIGLTPLLSWLAGRDSGWAAAASLLAPIVVPAVWTAAALTAIPPRRLLSGAAAAAGVSLVLAAQGTQGLVMAGFVLAGIAGGWAVRRRWGAWRIIGACILCLAPGLWLALAGTSIPAVLTELAEELRRQYADGLPADMPPAERTAALSAYDEAVGGTLEAQRRLWPSLALVGLTAQIVLFMGLGRSLARLAGEGVARPAIGPLTAWRAPFLSVWLLIGGLGLSLIGPRQLADLGWNLVLIAACLLAGQGVAVQAWLVKRLLPATGQVVFWIIGALFLAPVLLVSGCLIGLADQWWDLRRLREQTAGPR